MATIDDSVQVDVPAQRAYANWTRYEIFPRIMQGVREAQPVDDRHIHWRAEIWGKDVEWDSEITRVDPGRRIAWRSINGPENGGYIEFVPVSPDQTQIKIHIDYEPGSVVGNVGAALGATDSYVHRSLEHFKDFLESVESEIV